MGAVVSSDDETRRSEDDSEEEGHEHNSDDSDTEDSEDSSGDEEDSGDEDDDDDEDDEESSFFGDSDSDDSDTTESETDEEQIQQEVIITEGILVGCGAPLLTIIANVAPGYLDRYSLTLGEKREASEKESPIFEELVSWFQVNYLPGGETLTTVRVAQWMLHLPKATGVIGGIGNDTKGSLLSQICLDSGISPSFFVQDDEPTGAKACLKTSNCDINLETNVVSIAAGNTYSKQRHLDTGTIWTQMSQAQYYFCSGYFLTVCPETVLAIGEHSSEFGKTLSMSLGNPKFCRLFKDSQLAAIRYVDFLFANKEEALSFAGENDFETSDICEIARRLCLLPKVNSNKPRVVVITQGGEPTVVARGYDEVHEFEVDQLELDRHVQGVGAFFMGGFLSQLVQGHGLERCVEGAHYCSRMLITNGPIIGEECPFQ